MFFGGYPITPASAILHHLSRLKEFGVTTFQAEDEIAAIASAIGASYAGQLGVTSSSGPGIALKGEAMGLAIMTELPLVIVNSQRGGPSTGLPTKTEQSDLYQAVYGRNGDAPMPVIAARSPADAFDCAIEAVRIATQYHDAGDAADRRLYRQCRRAVEGARHERLSRPSRCAILDEAPEGGFKPYARDAKLARPWVKPGTPGLLHRIGGIEKQVDTGHLDYSPANHQAMTDLRAAKVDGIADISRRRRWRWARRAAGWRSSAGDRPSGRSTRRCGARGRAGWTWRTSISATSGRCRATSATLLKSYDKVIVPEMNTGQLKTVLRDQYLVDARPLNKVSGQPFRIAEIEDAIEAALGSEHGGEGEVPASDAQLPDPIGAEDLETAGIHVGANRSPDTAR